MRKYNLYQGWKIKVLIQNQFFSYIIKCKLLQVNFSQKKMDTEEPDEECIYKSW